MILRAVRNHPFIYQKMVGEVDPTARPGDVVQLYDKAGVLIGRGLYNPRSTITIRVLTSDLTPVDEDFWRARLGAAVALRRAMQLDHMTDAYRLVHAEGDRLSGLIAERYADCLVFEFFSLGMYRRAALFTRLFGELLGAPTQLDRPDRAAPTWRVALRADTRIEKLEGFHIPAEPHAGEPPPRLVIREHGIRYRVDVLRGQKTGFFCDQRDNRLRLAGFCRDAEVLDVCCYSGGFGLCAAKLGGAREVTGVDLDEDAIALARENANLNQSRLNLVHADAFAYLRQMIQNRRQYDVVVLDPPKFVLYREEMETGLQKYHDLNHLGIQLVRPGGLLLTCTCSGRVPLPTFLDAVHRAGQRAGRQLQLVDRTGAGGDHPVMLNCPESLYLKAVWLRVL